MTTLRQRMIDAMVLRGFRPRTQVSYLRAVSQLARHYHRSPELITDQEVQSYLLHLVRDRQLARTSVNQVSSATRFLICEVLGCSGGSPPRSSSRGSCRPSCVGCCAATWTQILGMCSRRRKHQGLHYRPRRRAGLADQQLAA